MAISRQLTIAFLLVSSVVGFFSSSPIVWAAEETCSCYCTSPVGAKSVPDATTKIERSDCQQRCTDRGQTVAAFACTANQHPSRSLNCFNAEQCAEVGGKLGENFQPPECPNGYFYCYPDPKKAAKTTLSTSIGGLSITGDLGEYVASAYKWMLGASTTIAIVFLMVAGLRWTFGGLSAEQIGKAKNTILNALIGLILLLSTYLILATVNPQLLKLQLPSFPMIKTVSLVGNTSCDDLIDEGYTIDYSGPEECGTVGTVSKDPEGNAVADGNVCNFSHCPNGRQICIPGDTPKCMLCEELTIDNPVLTPTASLCSAFNSLSSYKNLKETITSTYTPNAGPNKGKAMQYTQDVYRNYEQCFFTHDPDAGAEVTGRGACARVEIDCSEVSSCKDYNNAKVFIQTTSNSVALKNIDFGRNSGIDPSKLETLYTSAFGELGEFTLGSVCGYGPVNDMCAYKRVGDDNGKACEINSVDLLAITDLASYTAAYTCTYFDSDSWWANLFD